MQRASELGRVMAATMDAPEELLDSLPELFADLEDLGARAPDVVRAMELAQLPMGARVLDLGCGKGSAALALAQRFDANVLGVDGMEPFVDHARLRARALQVEMRCAFELDDVRSRLDRERGYDAVMLLALGDVLGDAEQTVSRLRRCVVPGGLILVDDAYRTEANPRDEQLLTYATREQTRAALEAHGDLLVHEQIVDDPQSAEHYQQMTDRIATRATDLARRKPHLAELLLDFAQHQRDEVMLLHAPLVGALWALRRSA